MKKLLAIAVVAAVGVAASWGATTNIIYQQELTLKGKLSPSKATVTNESLSGNNLPISFLDLNVISGTTTQNIYGIGQVTTNGFTTNVVVLLTESQYVILQPTEKRNFKYISVYRNPGLVGTSSNACLFVSGSQKVDSDIWVSSATVGGVWMDSTAAGGWTNGEAIVGTLSPVKQKK